MYLVLMMKNVIGFSDPWTFT